MSNITLAFGALSLGSTNNITIGRISEKASKPVQTTNIPVTDGAIAETAKIGPKTITVEGDICGTSYDNLKTNLDALHSGLLNGLQKFTKDDERYIYAQLKDFSFSYDHMTRRATWTAQFVAHSPFWLSTNLKSDVRAPSSGVGYTIANAGNAPTRLKVTLTCKSTNVDLCQFENTTRGELSKYRGIILPSKNLIVDNRVASDDFVVTNDSVSDFPNFEGDFLNLSAGNNTFEFTGTVPQSLLLAWYDAWY
jgi:hypothetical protein